MATSNSNRDVRMTLGVDVDAKGVDGLADDLKDLGAAGKNLSPEFAKVTAELEAAGVATTKFRAAEAALEAEVKASKQALTEQREALARARLTTSEADKATDAYRQSVKAAQLAILDSRAALRTQAEALDKAATSSRIAAAAEKNLADQLQRTGVAAASSGRQQAAANTQTAEGLQTIQNQLRGVQQAAAAIVGGQLLGGLVGDVAKTADAYANLTAHIKQTTGEGAAFTTAFNGVFEVAQRTGSSLDTVGDLFVKLAAAGKLVGLSNAEALSLTETIAQATQLSGASADSANAALTQLVQGLQSGVLRGDELNSVLEQAPRLAKALADGLGVTTGELRKLGEAGSLTATQVISALKGQGATLRAEFDQLPQTIGRSITNLSTAWTQYVGEVDKATGASSTIAGAINALAKNLDTVVSVLLAAGKTAAAFQAIRLAQTFLGIGAAAKVATAETVAFTAAQAAANGAAATSAAGVGRLASVMGTLKLGALVAVAVNIKSIGEAIGEQVAKWRGYGDVIRDAEGRMRAQEAAARSLAEANAALAQKAQIAADKALGLGVEAQALVGAFEKARQAGDTVADSLGKVSKALDLSNVQGINAAGAALDALAERSKITSDQVREALSAALKTEDLGKFQTEATAAFDGSEIGARRLAAAVDALGDESLRRAGLSAQELKTGFGAAAASAINDVDALTATLDRLGAKGPETGLALAQSLDKATAAAGTERALKALMERYEELGKSGRLSGDQVAAGLEKAREKIDGLLPGVGSLREALHDFGLRSSEEMQATATRFEESWKVIRDSVTTSLDDKIEAFEKYAAAAIAANKGVETSEISLQREMLRTRQIAVQGVSPPNGAPLRPQRTPASSPSGQKQANQQGGRNADGSYQRNEDSLGIIGPNQVVKSNLGDTREERLAGQNAVDNRLMFQLRDKLTAGTLEAGDVGALTTVIQSLKQNAQVNADVMRWNPGAVTLEGARDDRAWQATRAQFENAVARLEKPASSAAAPARTPTPAAGSSSHSLTIDLGGGRRGTFNMASESDASGLSGLLSQLANARGVS
jgi:tape measure domain-containing protein